MLVTGSGLVTLLGAFLLGTSLSLCEGLPPAAAQLEAEPAATPHSTLQRPTSGNHSSAELMLGSGGVPGRLP